MSSQDFDDFFFSDEFCSDSDYDPCSILNDDSIMDMISSLEPTDSCQVQAPMSNETTNQSQVSDLECRVCGAPAFGYNFDQITCESCKAFFRRNALRDLSSLKCRFAGSCVIDVNTRRRCAYCRLKKCFDVKMRKDWIRTEEEKVLRQMQKLAKEQNRLRNLSNHQEVSSALPVVARRRKRLMTKSTSHDGSGHPENSNC